MAKSGRINISQAETMRYKKYKISSVYFRAKEIQLP